MVEYAIYRINNGGHPFISGSFDNIMSAKMEIDKLVVNFNKYGYFYYIDNDYYDNVYPLSYRRTFYCKIISRDVSNWKDYQEFSAKSNNIVFLK